MEYDNPVFDLKLTDSSLLELINSRASTAEAHWEKKYKLKSIRETNKKLYTTEYAKERLRDPDEGEPAIDNRLFVAVRVLVPYLIDRLSTPEVTPADESDLAQSFSKDFERALAKEAKAAQVKGNFRLSLQDVLEGQRKGVAKMYVRDGKKCFERLDPADVLVGHRSKLLQEPEFIQEKQKRTIGELIKQFPAKKDAIKKLYGVTIETPLALDAEKDITENWLYVDDVNGDCQLGVIWLAGDVVLGKIVDPNYDYKQKGRNIVDEPMMPYIFLNLLVDGSGHEDETSFIEQAQYSQKNYDRDSQTISDDAKWGSSGVPVFAKDSLKDEDAAKVKFKPSQRLMLETEDVGKSFTTWNKPQMDKTILENKADNRNNVDNTFGTPAIFKGEESEAKTLGENVILRDQAQGRHTDIIDSIDTAMTRTYKLLAQLMMRYNTDEQYYKFLGDDGVFIKVIMDSEKIAKNAGIEIDVEAGTSLPVDRGQRRAVMMKLLELNKIGTLKAYRELGVDEPEEAFKEFMQEQTNPQELLAKVDKDVIDRDAEEDLYVVIGGKVPEERPDVSIEYVNYLNNWLMTEKYNQLTPSQQSAVSEFVQMVVGKGQLKAAKMASQMPMPAGSPGGPQAEPTIGPDGQPIPPGPPDGGMPPPPQAGDLPSMQGGAPPEQPTPGIAPVAPAGVLG